jgi:DNA uptake protein ComE-like DNA-binding protein
MNAPVLNQQEQKVLIVLCLIWVFGSGANLMLNRYPGWQSILNSLEEDRFVRRVDVNTASYEELVAIPYIGDFTARQLIRYRPFVSLEGVKSTPGIRSANFERFENRLTVGSSRNAVSSVKDRP